MIKLPPGQRARDDMPAFGLPWYGHRMPAPKPLGSIRFAGAEIAPFVVTAADLATLQRCTQVSDFHCVTTWSRLGVQWSGVRFRDVYTQLIHPRMSPTPRFSRVRFRGADGYSDTLPLADLLGDDVLLADRLDGVALTRANGAPLRLVAPAHYGYKNVKYVSSVELLGPPSRLARLSPSLHHPRARVAAEERFYGLPGWLIRYIFRPGINVNVWWFQRITGR